MTNIRTGKAFDDAPTMTRGGFLKGILASGIAPSITLATLANAESANASVGRGMMRNVGARVGMMGGGGSGFHYLHGDGTSTAYDDITKQAIAYYSDTNSRTCYSAFKTISLWFRKNSSHSHGTVLKLLGDWSGFAIGIGGSQFIYEGNNILILREGIAWDASGVTVSDFNWHCLTIVFTTSSRYSFYYDGLFSKTVSGSIRSFPFSSTAGDVDSPIYGVLRLLGYYPYHRKNPSEKYNRIANDVDVARCVIWGRNLSASEIQDDYLLGVDSKPSNMNDVEHMYTMSNVRGGIIYDEVGTWNMSQNLTTVI